MLSMENRFKKGVTRREISTYKFFRTKRDSSYDPADPGAMLIEISKNPKYDVMDHPNFRQLSYIRYAYDFVVFILTSK
jgi:hypothetical protein